MNLNNEYLKFYSYKTEDLDIRKLGLTDHRAKRSEYAKYRYLQFIHKDIAQFQGLLFIRMCIHIPWKKTDVKYFFSNTCKCKLLGVFQNVKANKAINSVVNALEKFFGYQIFPHPVLGKRTQK